MWGPRPLGANPQKCGIGLRWENQHRLSSWAIIISTRQTSYWCRIVAYIDFAKAVDVVSHNKSFIRLQSYGISGTLMILLTLFHRSHSVHQDRLNLVSFNRCNPWCYRGPLMFFIFIDELARILEKFGIRPTLNFFADDLKLYIRIVSDVDVCFLQDALDSVCHWAEDWQLSTSVNKCYALNIGKPTLDVSISVNNAILPNVTSCRHLGVMVVTKALTPSVPYRVVWCSTMRYLEGTLDMHNYA